MTNNPICTNKKPIQYSQLDKRWANNVYSNHGDKHQTMASSGSGPTLCADVVATLKDESVTPWDLAQLALEWGCRTRMSGTSWDFFAKVAEHFAFKKFVRSVHFDALVECLGKGGYVICSMKKGYWTRIGNYVLAWNIDSMYVYGIGTEIKGMDGKQTIDNFERDAKIYFCFYPD